MNLVATGYLIEGLTLLGFVVALLLVRRRVMATQWVIAASMFLYAVSALLKSCLYNNFLQGEYFLGVLYECFSLLVMPVLTVGTWLLVRTDGAPSMARKTLLPALAAMALIVADVALVGDDAYQAWLIRGPLSQWHPDAAHPSLAIVCFWLYWAVLLTYVVLYLRHTVRWLHDFRRRMDRLYADSQFPASRLRALLVVAALAASLLVVRDALPLVAWPSEHLVFALTLLQNLLMAAVGHLVYNLSYGAERLPHPVQPMPRRSQRDMAAFGAQLSRHIEQEQAYLDPDLSVFMLAKQYGVSEDDVVDALHMLHGTDFATYIDKLRIEHLTRLLLSEPTPSLDDPDQLDRLAHRCGYLGSAPMLRAFEHIMQQPLDQWL